MTMTCVLAHALINIATADECRGPCSCCQQVSSMVWTQAAIGETEVGSRSSLIILPWGLSAHGRRFPARAALCVLFSHISRLHSECANAEGFDTFWEVLQVSLQVRK